MKSHWIKIEHDTPDKLEVFMIAERLGLDRDAVVGKLVRIWSWADLHTVDGNVPGVTLALLDHLSSVTGFGQIMQEVGWIEETGDGLHFSKLERHISQSAKKRAQARRRVYEHRKRNDDVTDEALQMKRKSNADSVTHKTKTKTNNIPPYSPPEGDSPPAKKSTKVFKPPTDLEVAQWCAENNIPIDALAFVDHYRSNGWMVGKSKMKDWHAAARNWARRDRKPGGNSTRDKPLEDDLNDRSWAT